MSPADLHLVKEPEHIGRRARIGLWVAMIVGIIASGLGFAYKIAEFLFTLGDDGAKGFADVPVTVYFVVAFGWLLLLIWCFLTGKFTHSEQAKLDMIAMEEEYDRLGE